MLMDYRCVKCRQVSRVEDRIRCPYCGFRILAKSRPVFRKRVKAR